MRDLSAVARGWWRRDRIILCPGAFGDKAAPDDRGAAGPRAPVYFGRAGRMAGDAVASNFGRCPDSALTTCARSRRNSCIRDTRSSTFGTGERFGPRPRLEEGRLFCTMKYFHNWSDDNAAKTRSKNRWRDCEIPGMSRQERPRTKVSCKRYRYLARFASFTPAIYPDLFERNVNNFMVSITSTAQGSPGPRARNSNFRQFAYYPVAPALAAGAVKPGFVAVLWRNRPHAKIIIQDFARDLRPVMPCKPRPHRGAACTFRAIAANAAGVD